MRRCGALTDGIRIGVEWAESISIWSQTTTVKAEPPAAIRPNGLDLQADVYGHVYTL